MKMSKHLIYVVYHYSRASAVSQVNTYVRKTNRMKTIWVLGLE